MQEEEPGVVGAIVEGDLAGANLPEAERVLLEFAGKLTREAHKTRDEDVERLRAAGWNDEQIAEAVYVTALFAFFNRVADAFGLEDPRYFERLQRGEDGLPVASDADDG